MSSLEIRLPALSATMEEATVLSWFVKPGDTVAEGQPIAEVSTDKVDMELESPYAGTIQELLAQQGDTVPLGAAMATIESEADDLLGGLFDGSPEVDGSPEAPPTRPRSQSPRRHRARRSRSLRAAPPPATAPTTIVPAAPAARKLAHGTRDRPGGTDPDRVPRTGHPGRRSKAGLR